MLFFVSASDMSALEEAWFKAVIQGKVDTLVLLLDDGANVNASHPSNQRSALHVAVDLGLTNLVKWLLEVMFCKAC
jgi:ankyrin repeat protein